jgi:hypothetical protein
MISGDSLGGNPLQVWQSMLSNENEGFTAPKEIVESGAGVRDLIWEMSICVLV